MNIRFPREYFPLWLSLLLQACYTASVVLVPTILVRWCDDVGLMARATIGVLIFMALATCFTPLDRWAMLLRFQEGGDVFNAHKLVCFVSWAIAIPLVFLAFADAIPLSERASNLIRFVTKVTGAIGALHVLVRAFSVSGGLRTNVMAHTDS